jgi:hypothetical protein
MKVDYSNNIIISGSLQLNNFETAKKLHYKNPGITPRQYLGLIIGNNFDALMLKTPMLIQACIPHRVANQIGGTIQLLMEALKTQSEWISISKTISANKTLSKLLSTWLYETMTHINEKRRNNHNNQPIFTATFIYQEQLTIKKYKKLISSGTDNTLGHPTLINCAEWTNYIKKPFNQFARQINLNHISPSTPSSRHSTKISHHCMV